MRFCPLIISDITPVKSYQFDTDMNKIMMTATNTSNAI